MEVNCKHCKRYLFKQVGTVVIEGIICPNSKCKARMNFKIIESDETKGILYKFAQPETLPKSQKSESVQ